MTLVDTNLISRYLHRDAETKYRREHEFVDGLIESGNLAISYITQFELRRGVEDLVLKGQGRRKLVDLEKFLDRVEVLGLDAGNGMGWNLAARFWAKARQHRSAIVLSDADLLVAATAALHGRAFATSEARLVNNLRQIEFPAEMDVVEASPAGD
jgi:predicted nucleic acid-binding protein